MKSAPADRKDSILCMRTVQAGGSETFLQGAAQNVEAVFKIQDQEIVEEQIDETDIRKIPQIVWAESGSLTVPV
jgi:hypothetical protein